VDWHHPTGNPQVQSTNANHAGHCPGHGPEDHFSRERAERRGLLLPVTTTHQNQGQRLTRVGAKRLLCRRHTCGVTGRVGRCPGEEARTVRWQKLLIDNLPIQIFQYFRSYFTFPDDQDTPPKRFKLVSFTRINLNRFGYFCPPPF